MASSTLFVFYIGGDQSQGPECAPWVLSHSTCPLPDIRATGHMRQSAWLLNRINIQFLSYMSCVYLSVVILCTLVDISTAEQFHCHEKFPSPSLYDNLNVLGLEYGEPFTIVGLIGQCEGRLHSKALSRESTFVKTFLIKCFHGQTQLASVSILYVFWKCHLCTFYCFFWDRVSLHNPDWFGTQHCPGWSGTCDPLASALRVLGLQACATRVSFIYTLCQLLIYLLVL